MHRIFSEIAYGKWGIDPRAAAGLLPIVVNFVKGIPMAVSAEEASRIRQETSSVTFASVQNGVYTVSEFGGYSKPENAPPDSVGVIEIGSTIYYNDAECGPAGMKTKANLFDRLVANPNVKAITIDFRTPGGEGEAMLHMVESIQKSTKPVIGFARGLCASAGLGMITATNYIIAGNELTEVGSCGTFGTLYDFSEYLEMQGVHVEEIYATRSTEKNKPYRDWLKGDKAAIQANIDVFNEAFINMVATNRTGMLTDDGHWHKGKLYYAPEALEIGLIDEIGSFDRAIEKAIELANQ